MINGVNYGYCSTDKDEEERLIDSEWGMGGGQSAGERDVLVWEGKQKREHSLLSSLLSITDAAFSLFVLFPIVVLHWRGTWQLLVSQHKFI